MSNSVGVSVPRPAPPDVTRRRAMSISRSPTVTTGGGEVSGRGATQQRADARQQLARREGLGQVVVGALVQRLDLVGLVGAHRQDEDRRRHPGAQLAADLDAAAVGQRQIEHHEVGRLVDGRAAAPPGR